MTPYVLIVEDETAISTLLEYNLQKAWQKMVIWQFSWRRNGFPT